MPDGVIQWFDAETGEGVVVRSGRRFRAFAADVEPVARQPGARVHFDVRREKGVERAVEVRLRSGTRVSSHQHRFGTLKGARRPDAKGASPFARVHADLDRVLAVHPLEIAVLGRMLSGAATSTWRCRSAHQPSSSTSPARTSRGEDT